MLAQGRRVVLAPSSVGTEVVLAQELRAEAAAMREDDDSEDTSVLMPRTSMSTAWFADTPGANTTW